jgi:predicted protein tyrosine phosphatase
VQKIDFEVFHHVCGFTELAAAPFDKVLKIVSIGSPDEVVPLPSTDLPVLSLRFHDEILPSEGIVLPTKADMQRLLDFDAGANVNDGLLVHCAAGMSRSTAALAVLLAQRHPGCEDTLFPYIRQIRPIAWPNSLMVTMGDELLGLDGRLVRALREHYKIQVKLFPSYRDELRAGGRRDEVPEDEASPRTY